MGLKHMEIVFVVGNNGSGVQQFYMTIFSKQFHMTIFSLSLKYLQLYTLFEYSEKGKWGVWVHA